MEAQRFFRFLKSSRKHVFLGFLLILLFVSVVPVVSAPDNSTYYVATGGSDLTGDGSQGTPWATITHAINNVTDGSLILVAAGDYLGQVHLDRVFSQGVTIRSQTPYQARLRNSGGQVVVCFYGQHITLEGFDIAHSPENTSALVIQVQDLLGAIPGIGDGDDPVVSFISLRNNIIHDSTNNDLLKVNNGARNIVVEGNMFYNQRGSDEHIDINSVVDVIVQDNIFYNDLTVNNNDTGAYVLVKDSNGDSDGVIGASQVTVRRNIFLNWQGSDGATFLLLGEDGKPYYEAYDILAENNLMIGNSSNMQRAAFGVKGGRDIIFRNNTVVGNLPARAFAMRLNQEGSNPVNQNIHFYNNVWSDPSGTMGTESFSGVDFAEVDPLQNSLIPLDNNLYWNGPSAIPSDITQLIHYTDDGNRTVADPLLGSQAGLVLPNWNGIVFADGSISIREAFERLVNLYGKPAAGSPVLDAASFANAALDDILGSLRGPHPDIGVYQTTLPKNIYLPLIFDDVSSYSH